jgi:hypothetical protein
MKLNKILIPALALFIFIAFSGKAYSQDGSMNNETKKANEESVFDKEGYDQYGFNKEGYDREGYNKEGYNKEGRDRKGNLKSTTDPNSGIEIKPETPPGADKDKSTEVAPEQKGHEIDKDKKQSDGNSGDVKEKKKKKNKRNKNKNK